MFDCNYLFSLSLMTQQNALCNTHTDIHIADNVWWIVAFVKVIYESKAERLCEASSNYHPYDLRGSEGDWRPVYFGLPGK